MKRAEFKIMEQRLWLADENDQIWWNGYLFIDLTAKQNNRVCSILRARGFKTKGDGEVILMPSGLGIREVKEF